MCLCALRDSSHVVVIWVRPMQRNISSNKSDEWENMTTKKAYIESWLHDPQFPGGGSTPRTPPIDFSGTAVTTSATAGAQSHRGKEEVCSDDVGSTMPISAMTTMEQR